VRLIACVYDALRTVNRPCTRVEIEQVSGLDKDSVREGLDGLRRRQDLLIERDRRSNVYMLRPGAQRPVDLRGRHTQSEQTRERISGARRGHRVARPPAKLADGQPVTGRHSAARPPSHISQSSALRTTAQRVELKNSPCALERFWPPKKR